MLTAAVFAASAVVTSLSGAPRPLWPGFGVRVNFETPSKPELDLLAKGRIQYVRSELAWDLIEKQDGVYDFSSVDGLLAKLKTKAIRPIFHLSAQKKFLAVAAKPSSDAGAAYIRWAGEVANHFKGEEVIFEIDAQPGAIAASATDSNLLAESAKAMRFMDAQTRLVVSGVVGADTAFWSRTLTEEVIALVDGVAYSPARTGGPENTVSEVTQIKEFIRRRAPEGRKSLPVICDAWGCSTAKGLNTEGRQAMYVSRLWLLNSALGVPITIYDSWQDNGPNAERPSDRLGLVRENLDIKPAFIAAKEAQEKFKGCTSFTRLRQSDPLSWVIVGAGNGRMVQAKWHQREAGITFKQMPLKDKWHKDLYARLNSSGGEERTVGAAPNALAPKLVTPALEGFDFAFAPPLDDDGWCVVIDKATPNPAKLEFKYVRSSGVSVTCYAKVSNPRSVEALAMSEPKATISIGTTGAVAGSFRVESVSIEPEKWELKKEGNLTGELTLGQRGLLLNYGGAGKAAISPLQQLAIPEGAKALVVWIKQDGSGNKFRSEYRDAAGEVVSVELGAFEGAPDRDGWRAIKIPLNGNAAEWVSLLLVEAEKERGGAIEIGPAAYMF
jgi:hypothetical protein